MNLTIRPLKTAEDGRHLEEISLAAWGCEGIDVIPSHLSLTVAKDNGGVILLAYDDDRPIGFCWGFWSYIESQKKWKCSSHQAGVIPEYKGMGIGEKIKWAQRDFVIEKGFDLMTWTFDPLETMNGSLNIRKLGAVCSKYHENLYGELDDELNRGIPTDRFSADWWLTSDWVQQHAYQNRQIPSVDSILAEDGLFLNDAKISGDLIKPADGNFQSALAARPRYLILKVPRNFQQVKKIDLQAGVAWRLHTRELFTAAFQHNYTTIDLIPDTPLCYYIFERDWQYS